MDASDRPSSSTTGPSGNGHSAATGQPGGGRLGDYFSELSEYAAYFLSAKIDSVKVTARKAVVYACLGIVGLIAMLAVIVTSVVMLLAGLANAIGAIFDPDQPWVGQLVVSVLVLGGLAAGVIFGMKWLTNTSERAMKRKYETMQLKQRVRFGRDVEDQAQAGRDHGVA